MKPLTREELHAIKKTATGDDAMSVLVRRLCELAERSIPRPISEYPLDGSGGEIDAWDRDGRRWTDVYFKDGWWKAETSDRCHRIYDPDFVSFVPVPPVWLPEARS